MNFSFILGNTKLKIILLPDLNFYVINNVEGILVFQLEIV